MVLAIVIDLTVIHEEFCLALICQSLNKVVSFHNEAHTFLYQKC